MNIERYGVMNKLFRTITKICIGAIILCPFLSDIVTAEMDSVIQMIADFSDPSVVSSLGMPSSTDITLNGTSTMKLQGPGKTLEFEGAAGDWSGYSALVVNVYSERATNENIYFCIQSTNPTVSGNSYYLGTLTIDFEGWKEVRFDIKNLSNLTISRTPLGMDQITGLFLWCTFSNVTISEETV